VPEGDSVWRLARRLDRSLLGQRLSRTDLRVPKLATTDLAGRTVLEHATHGKHLLTRLSGGLTLHTHLEMDGSWTVTRPGRTLPRRLVPDVRVVLATEAGHTAYGMKLPVVELLETAREADVVGHLGPDLLAEDWDAGEAVRRLGASPAGRWSRRCSTSASSPVWATCGPTSWPS
jgi:formamidopyrimidine-DNA glycosylase